MSNSEFITAIERCENIALSLYNKAHQHEKSKEKIVGTLPFLDIAAKNMFTDPITGYFVGISFALIFICTLIFFPFSEPHPTGTIVILVSILLLTAFISVLGFMLVFLPKFRRIQREILKITRQEWRPAFEMLCSLNKNPENNDERNRYKLLHIYDKFIREHFANRTSINKMPDWVAANVYAAEAVGISADKVIGNRVVRG